jgi:hypothetical protein
VSRSNHFERLHGNPPPFDPRQLNNGGSSSSGTAAVVKQQASIVALQRIGNLARVGNEPPHRNAHARRASDQRGVHRELHEFADLRPAQRGWCLKGRKVYPGVRVLVVPGSQRIRRRPRVSIGFSGTRARNGSKRVVPSAPRCMAIRSRPDWVWLTIQHHPEQRAKGGDAGLVQRGIRPQVR